MKIIPLTQGKSTIVDDEDYDYLMQRKWNHDGKGYAVYMHRIPRAGKIEKIFMHRMITGAKDGESVDHINGNKSDNRRANLRICTVTENIRNRGKQKNNKSGYKGVWWDKKKNRYAAAIMADGKRIFVGVFHDPVEAARAYDKKAKELHGEFAGLNFPE